MKLVIVLSLVFAGAAHAQMFKCTNAAGKVEYRGSPCEDSRQARGISGGTVSGIDAMSQTEMQRAARSGGPERGGPSVTIIGDENARRVPTEREIRNLEVSASSRTSGDTAFLKKEVERMKAARESGTTYSERELRQLKDAQDAQKSITGGAARGKREAEAIHMESGAPGVGEQIVQDHQQEEARKAARRAAAVAAGAAAAQQAAQAAAAGPTYDRIAQCTGGICQGQSGETYRPFPGVPDSFNSSSGKRCTRGVSGELACY